MAATLTIKCLGSGIGAYFVDGGRPGYRDRGIATGGAAVPALAEAANKLLDQAAKNCCIELTMQGGAWLLSGSGQIALTGADMRWTIDGESIDRYRVHYIDGEHVLSAKAAIGGSRAYFSARGNWELPRVLNSVEAGLPGTIQVSQGLTIAVTSSSQSPFRNDLHPAIPGCPLRLVASPGPEWSRLAAGVRSYLLTQTFTVSPRSGRQGIRLLSTTLPVIEPYLMLSSPVIPGTVQLSPAGPILLGPDAQTIGGYPRPLQVDDFGPAFELMAGQALCFVLASPAV